MKKRTLGIIGMLLATVAISAFPANAQDNGSIGCSHTISFGAAYGYGASPLVNFGSGIIDINFGTGLGLPKDSYLRTRLQLDLDAISVKVAPAVGATFQYMQHIAAGLYVYPFAGAKFEHHTISGWTTPNDFCPVAGAGIEYQFTSWIGAFTQGAYEYGIGSKTGIPIVQAGIVFAFGNGRKASKKNAANNDSRAAAESAKAAERAAEITGHQSETEPQPTIQANRINKGTTVSIPFMKDSYQVGRSATAKILAMVPYLMSNPEAKVEIAAYGDKNSGNANPALAEKREKAVRDILTGAGISADRITLPEVSKTPAVTAQPGSVAIVTIK